jgi:hypothetical protein
MSQSTEELVNIAHYHTMKARMHELTAYSYLIPEKFIDEMIDELENIKINLLKRKIEDL